MDIIAKQLMGGEYIAAGESSARTTCTPTFRFRTRHGAGASLVDLAPDSAPWRPPVL